MTFRFDQRAARGQEPLPWEPYDNWRSLDGEILVTFHRTRDGYHIRFLDRADFSIDIARRCVTATPTPDIAVDASDLWANQVLPLLWSYEGKLVIHASAVQVDGGAVAFMGPTGRGKSTLAAAFANAGHPFLTDDGLVLEVEAERYLAKPNLASVRLFADSEAAVLRTGSPDESEETNGKTRIAAHARMPHHEEPAVLRAIYVLRDASADATGFRLLERGEAFDALIQHSFMLDTDDRRRMRAHFGRIACLAERVRCFELDYPRRFAELDDVVRQVLSHVRREGR